MGFVHTVVQSQGRGGSDVDKWKPSCQDLVLPSDYLQEGCGGAECQKSSCDGTYDTMRPAVRCTGSFINL
jgi:hypothetical protein